MIYALVVSRFLFNLGGKMSSYVYKEPSLKYRFIINFLIVSFILFVILGSFYIAPEIGFISFFLIVFILLVFMIFLHSNNTAYICKNCNHEFEISFWQDLTSAHSPRQKMLKCPECLLKDYASELVKTKSNLNE